MQRYSLFFDKKDIDTVTKETFKTTQQEMDEIQDDTLKIANQALATAIQAEQIGAETLEVLDAQGKQLQGTQDDVDQIIENQGFARRHLRQLSHFFGGLFNKFIPEPELKDHNSKVDEKLEKEKSRAKPLPATSPVANEDELSFLKLNQSSATKWRQTDEVLDQIGDHVNNLKVIATQMGEEVHEHNERLDVLNETADTAVVNMHDLTKETNRIRRGL